MHCTIQGERSMNIKQGPRESTPGWLALIGLASLLIWPCPSAHAQANKPLAAGPPPVPVRILLAIPDEFASFSYASLIRGRETRHLFGVEAQAAFRNMIAPEFMVFKTRRVSSPAAAMAMLSPGDPNNAQTREFDYLAIPRFARVNVSARGRKYGFDVDILVDFHATDGRTITTIEGHGESTTGVHFSISPQEAGNLALRCAMEALRDAIIGRRELFVPSRARVEPPREESSRSGPQAGRCSAPLPVKVLLAVPDEFSRYAHQIDLGEGGIENDIGGEAERQFRIILSPGFETLVIRPTESESAAMEMLSSHSPANIDARGFDYVAIPRFTRIDSRVRGSHYMFSAEIQLRFYPVSGLREVTIKGLGKYDGDLDGGAAEEAIGRAIKTAVKAIRESIDQRHDLFVP